MRLTARCPTKTELEFTFLEPRIGCLRQNTKHSRSVFMHVHNILILTRAARHTCKFCLSTTSGNHTINHVRGTYKTIHNQPGTMFPHLIRAKYHQITLTHSITLAFSTSIIRCINFPDSVELFKIPDVDDPFWKGHIEAGHQNNFQTSPWPGQKSASILLWSNRFDF